MVESGRRKWRTNLSSPCYFFSVFAQESRRVTVRLKTGVAGLESWRSAVKYPMRSNWTDCSGRAVAASAGSTVFLMG